MSKCTVLHAFYKAPATNETKVNVQRSFLCTELCTIMMLTAFFANHSATCQDRVVPVEMKHTTDPTKNRMNTVLAHAEEGQRVRIRKTLP